MIKLLDKRLRITYAIKLLNSLITKVDERIIKLNIPLPLKIKNVRFAAGAFVILFLAFIILVKPLASSSDTVPVYKVKQGDFLVSITESGELRAQNSITIAAPKVQGSLKIVYMVPEGIYVHSGDTVVKFDPTEALNNLRNAESRLEMSISDRVKMNADQKSQLTNMESALKEAELSYELSKLNMEQMKFEAAIKQQQSKLELERNQLSLSKAKQELESQKIIQKSELSKMDIQVQQSRKELEKAKSDLAALTLTAPNEGLVVYETNLSTGRKIMIGDSPWPGMTLISLPDLSAMQSITYVNEVDISKVYKGQKVIVKLDAFQDSTYNGIVSSVAQLGRTKDRNSTIKVFEVEIEMLSMSPILKPGMTTNNKIIIKQIPHIVYIPQESVFDKEGKRIVYIKDGSGFYEREVKVGEKSEDYIVINRGVLPDEDIALIDPYLNMKDNEEKENNTGAFAYPSKVK